jgi:hypothetical protein
MNRNNLAQINRRGLVGTKRDVVFRYRGAVIVEVRLERDFLIVDIGL